MFNMILYVVYFFKTVNTSCVKYNMNDECCLELHEYFLSLIDDSAKRGGWPTLELFTMILCGPNFSVCYCFEPKIIRLLLLSLKSPQFQFETKISSNNDFINV